MAEVEFLDDDVHIDATINAEGLGIGPALLQAGMRDGAITGVCERGTDEDAGRYRLTFFHESRRLRLVVDEACNVIQRSMVDFGEFGIPASGRRAGP